MVAIFFRFFEKTTTIVQNNRGMRWRGKNIAYRKNSNEEVSDKQ
jgi:hypothetical protein